MTLGSNKVLMFYPCLLAVQSSAVWSEWISQFSLTCCLPFGLWSQHKDQQFLTRLTPGVISCSPSCPVCCGGLLYISQHPHSPVLKHHITRSTLNHSNCLRMASCSAQKCSVMELLHDQNSVAVVALVVIILLLRHHKACFEKKTNIICPLFFIDLS